MWEHKNNRKEEATDGSGWEESESVFIQETQTQMPKEKRSVSATKDLPVGETLLKIL